jgi:aerobic carbon-monoxide dehydrogenase small subunit
VITTFVLNEREVTLDVAPRTSLVDALREHLGLTGTHVGCEHGVCGACTVLLEGQAVRGCLLFAVQVEGARVTTIEALGGADGALHPVQEAFREHHALQCGFCTPGMILTVTAFLADRPDPTDDEIREAIAGNLCMCTGYQNIVRATRAAARGLREARRAQAGQARR